MNKEILFSNKLCREKIENIINNLENNYKDNPYILEKLNTYINQNLNQHLEQFCIKENKKYINLIETLNQREEKKIESITNQQLFINKFLQKNTYFYINNTDIFIYYDNVEFKTKKEDDILHDILRNISLDKNLLLWKHKIKFATIKKLKEQTIFKVIPNSITIQQCLNILVPEIFLLKEEAKYFLTAIGDCILKKNENLIYLLNHNFKNLFKLLSDQCYYYFGINLNNNFKYKYHEQVNHNNYRLITHKKDNINLNIINKNILNILCISLHYSNRFVNAEEFIKNLENDDLNKYSLYLKNNSVDVIVDNFINKSLKPCSNTNITSKNMLYLWKLYLEENNLPTLIFQNTLKSILKTKLNYNNDDDIFIDIFSSSLPQVSIFLEFWENTIIEEEDELGLELSELNILFKIWNKNQINIKYSLILDIIKYYYPDIIIENDKYILNIRCNLWNKKEDINKFLDDIKYDLSKKNQIYPIAIDYLYDIYCTISKKNICTTDKQYFSKYISELLNNYIDEDNLIQSNWWINN